ncbi:hypothetical protein P7C73_g4591, partial [Tremellales sp. Uapishka_1]
MSTKKPSYAAVAASHQAEPSASSSTDAPPPYTAPPAEHGQNPHQTLLPPQNNGQAEEGYMVSFHNTWTPPPNDAVAKARALRRFWGAVVWAFAIWFLLGLLLGGGISDAAQNPSGRKGHWNKHGEWKGDDRVVILPHAGVEVEFVPAFSE